MVNVVRDNWMDFVVMLLNNLTDPAGRPVNQVDTFSLSGETSVTLTKSRAKNVRGVTLDAVALAYRDDYTVDYINGKVNFTTPKTGSVQVNYDYGSTWIYAEYPRLEDVTLPRISVSQIGPTQIDLTVGASNILYEFSEQVDIWTDTNTQYTFKGEPCKGVKLREFIAGDVVDVIRNKRLWIPHTMDQKISTMVPSVEEVKKSGKTVRTVFRGRFDIYRSYFYAE